MICKLGSLRSSVYALIMAEGVEGPPDARRAEDARAVVHHHCAVVGDAERIHGRRKGFLHTGARAQRLTQRPCMYLKGGAGLAGLGRDSPLHHLSLQASHSQSGLGRVLASRAAPKSSLAQAHVHSG